MPKKKVGLLPVPDYTDSIKSQPITAEIKKSYMDYAMSVIVARALPDVRDGMKPVHRRILYSMHENGLKSTAKFRKSATVVGDVLSKYHPHGDMAVYDSMVRMAQDFSLRYPLIWGQGNFGSMDGDSAAAHRYTEAKLQKIAEEMLFDIEKDTVNFQPNYDNSRKEPTVLPAKLPNLLLNGTMGIAVGMATNIPPHNITELIDGTIHLIDHPDATIEDLTQFITGPDFPTGGTIYDKKDILNAYTTGRGRVVTRATARITETDSGMFQIIVSEMTYQTNKALLIEKIAHLVRDNKIQGIRDLRDESDKDGVRVVVDLKKDAYPQKVLNQLYTLTDLQKNFNFNMLALVDGVEPQILNLKTILSEHIKHRFIVVTRRTQFELNKAIERAHILEGLKIALDNIDEIISIIKKSKDREIAHVSLMKKFMLSERQTTAILEMRLQTLSGLERQKIEDELKEKQKIIAYLRGLLKDESKLFGIIKNEFLELKEKYGDMRRTKVVKRAVDSFSQEDLIPNDEAIITLSSDGYIKRMSPNVYRVQHRGGKGVIGTTTKEGDSINTIISAMTHDHLLFFTNTGKVFRTQAYEIPESSRIAKGNALVNFLQLAQEEKVTEIIAFSKDAQFNFLFMATSKGNVKKVKISDFENVRRSGLISIKLEKDDFLGWVTPTTGDDTIILTTSRGQAIRFLEKDVRAMGRNATGVRGIRLKNDDRLVGMNNIGKDSKNTELMIITENGLGKRSTISSYKIQKRGGSGIKTASITAKTGKIISGRVIYTSDIDRDLIITSQKGQIIRVPLSSVPILGRVTQGVRIMKPKAGDVISATTVL